MTDKNDIPQGEKQRDTIKPSPALTPSEEEMLTSLKTKMSSAKYNSTEDPNVLYTHSTFNSAEDERFTT